MPTPLKILVLNDDCLGATTVYDEVQSQGFKVLNGPITKEIYQRHHSYNRLLSAASVLAQQLVFEPSDFFAPCIRLSPDLMQELKFTKRGVEGNSYVLQPQAASSDLVSADKSQELFTFEQMPAADSQSQKLQRQTHAEAAYTHIAKTANNLAKALAETEGRALGAGAEAQAHETRQQASLEAAKIDEDSAVRPLQPSEFTWWNQVLFFTLDDYTNLDVQFVARNFDGIFFFCHHPLGSKVLPEGLLSLLLYSDLPDLWLFNVQFDPKQMLLALKLSQGKPSLELLQALQSMEFQQLQAFLDQLIPRTIHVGCLTQDALDQLKAYALYTHKELPECGLTRNVYQYLHYVNQVRSLCNSALGLSSALQRTSTLNPNPSVARMAYMTHMAQAKGAGAEVRSSSGSGSDSGLGSDLESGSSSILGLDRAIVQALQQDWLRPKSTNLQAKEIVGGKAALVENQDTLSGLAGSQVLESTVEQYPRQLFSCSVPKTALWSSNGQPSYGAVYVPHIVLSSQHFHFNQILGMEMSGVRLILQMLATFPDANFSLMLNEGVYSWLEQLSTSSILWQDLAELSSRNVFIEAAKGTGELLSNALQSRIVKNLRQHILASFADPQHWPWTDQQRSVLEQVVERLYSPLESRIFCYQSLSEQVLKLPIDLVCSDIQSDLVSASAHGLAVVELVENPGVRKAGFKLHTKEYILGFAQTCDFEQASFLRFIQPQLEQNDRIQDQIMARQLKLQQKIQDQLNLLTGQALTLGQSVNCASRPAAFSNLNQSAVQGVVIDQSAELGVDQSGNKMAPGAGGAILEAMPAPNQYQSQAHSQAQAATSIGKSQDSRVEAMDCARAQASIHGSDRDCAHARAHDNIQDSVSVSSSVERIASSQLSHYGLHLGIKLPWLEIMQDVHLEQYLYCAGTLEELVSACFKEHVKFLRHLGKSLQARLQARQAHKQAQSSMLRQAQLSNYTYAKRYHLHYLALRYFAQLAHASGFGDGATLAESLSQCDLSTAFMEAYAHNPQLKQLMHSSSEQWQWPVFKPLSLSVLSFGCSRGDEIFDLLPLFNGQCFTGIDINPSAIAAAQKQLQGMTHISLESAEAELTKLYALPNILLSQSVASRGDKLDYGMSLSDLGTVKGNFTSLESVSQENEAVSLVKADLAKAMVQLAPESLGATSRSWQETFKQRVSALNVEASQLQFGDRALEPQLIKYLGAVGLINFASSADFFKLYADPAQYPQYDVVTVMTVLCRHPETLHARSAQGIYDFAEFFDTVKLLHQLVKKGGLLCIFNSNYSLLDTPLADKYVGVFPQLPLPMQPKLEAKPSKSQPESKPLDNSQMKTQADQKDEVYKASKTAALSEGESYNKPEELSKLSSIASSFLHQAAQSKLCLTLSN